MKKIAVTIFIFLLTVTALNSRSISNNGLNLIRKYEGCRLTSYYCPAGVLTIGYGHTGRDVFIGQKITMNQAINLLKIDVTKFERYVTKRITIPLKQHQFDALVDHSFNNGSIKSGLYRAIMMQNHELAAYKLTLYNKAGGRVLKGLVRRANERSKVYKDKYYEVTI